MLDALEKRITDAGHEFQRIPASPEMPRQGVKWEEPPFSADAQLADAAATEDAVGSTDWIVVDHYLLDRCWHTAGRRFADRILVIDDLANRSYDCDILLDQNFGRSVEDYRALVPDDARILVGASFAPLRPEFARERPAALERRQAGGRVRRILVSMGTADPGGITARVLEQLLAVGSEYAMDVVLGPQATSLDHVRELAARYLNISVHVDSERMAEFMAEADIAIGAAGTTSWERCCLGLPSIAIVLAENQRLAATNLERAGAAFLAESPEVIPALFRRMADDERMRLSMIAAAAAVTDGNGARRIAEAMIGQTPEIDNEPTIRPATPEDSRMVWLWRNDDMTRTLSQTRAPIPWPDHRSWWDKTLASTDRQLLIAEVRSVAVAALRFDHVGEDEFEVSINLAPSARGSGLGGRILAEACKTFEEKRAPVSLTATIHTENPASRRIFEKVGFVRADALSNSPFERYVLPKGMAK